MADAARRRLLLAACIASAGSAPLSAGVAAELKQRVETVASFHSVALDVPADVVLEAGDAPLVSIRAEAKVLARISVRVEDGVLDVRSDGSFQTQQPIDIRIVSSRIRALHVAGAATALSRMPSEAAYSVTVTDSAELSLEQLNLSSLEIDLQGSASLQASGQAETVSLRSGDATMLEGETLVCKQLTARINGSAEASVTVQNALDAEIDDAAILIYFGNPTIRSRVRGAGSLEQA